MTNITTYPLIDDFETTLAQERDGATGTVYLDSVPSFTFPASVQTYMVSNPGKTNMQAFKISAIDTSAKTVTVSSISVNK
jgi:VCBS repeat-containing protein